MNPMIESKASNSYTYMFERSQKKNVALVLFINVTLLQRIVIAAFKLKPIRENATKSKSCYGNVKPTSHALLVLVLNSILTLVGYGRVPSGNPDSFTLTIRSNSALKFYGSWCWRLFHQHKDIYVYKKHRTKWNNGWDLLKYLILSFSVK